MIRPQCQRVLFASEQAGLSLLCQLCAGSAHLISGLRRLQVTVPAYIIYSVAACLLNALSLLEGLTLVVLCCSGCLPVAGPAGKGKGQPGAGCKMDARDWSYPSTGCLSRYACYCKLSVDNSLHRQREINSHALSQVGSAADASAPMLAPCRLLYPAHTTIMREAGIDRSKRPVFEGHRRRVPQVLGSKQGLLADSLQHKCSRVWDFVCMTHWSAAGCRCRSEARASCSSPE